MAIYRLLPSSRGARPVSISLQPGLAQKISMQKQTAITEIIASTKASMTRMPKL